MFDKKLLKLVPGVTPFIVGALLARVLRLLMLITIVINLGNLLELIIAPGKTLQSVGDLPHLPLLLIAGATILMALASYASRYLDTKSALLARKKIREQLFAKLAEFGSSYQQHASTAEMLQLGVEGTQALETYFGGYISQLFFALLAPCILFIALVAKTGWLVALLLILVPLIPISIMIVMKRAKKIAAAYWRSYVDLGGAFLEAVQGLTTLKVFSADAVWHKKMNSKSEGFRKATMRMLVSQLRSIVVMDSIAYGGAALGIILALLEFVWGAPAAPGGYLSADPLGFFHIGFSGVFCLILLSQEFFLPMRNLGSLFHAAMNGTSAAKRMFVLLETKVEESSEAAFQSAGQAQSGGAASLSRAAESVGSAEGAQALEQAAVSADTCTAAELRVRDLSYSYKKRQVLSNFSCELLPGQVLALVGESGSGKSTVAQILAKRLRGYEGSVLFAKKELSGLSSTELCRRITLVSTNAYLLKGSIRQNLLLARPQGASESELWDCLSRAAAADFVRELGGLDASLEEGAQNLSGGQKQRLALARALLHESDLYIFDESISNVDVESEKLITKTMFDLAAAGKSVLIIAHRLFTIQDAQEIVVLEKGKVVQRGSHQELLAQKGAYARLWKEQEGLSRYAEKLAAAEPLAISELKVSSLEAAAPASQTHQAVNSVEHIDSAQTAAQPVTQTATQAATAQVASQTATQAANNPAADPEPAAHVSSTSSKTVFTADQPAKKDRDAAGDMPLLSLLRRMLELVKPLRGVLVLAVVLGTLGHLAAIFLSTFGIFALADAIGKYGTALTQSAAGGLLLARIWPWFIPIALVGLTRGALRYGEQLCNHYLAFKLLAHVRDRIFTALRRLAPAILETRQKGDLVSLCTSDVELLELFYAHTISPVLIATLCIVVLCAFVASFSLPLALGVLLLHLIIAVLVPYVFSKFTHQAGFRARKAAATTSSYVLESLRGAAELMQYQGFFARCSELDKKTEAQEAIDEHLNRLSSALDALTNFLLTAGSLIFMYVSLGLYLQGTINFVTFFVSSFTLFASFAPTLAVSHLAISLQSTLGSGRRVCALLEERPVAPDILVGKNPVIHSASARNLSFTYPEPPSALADYDEVTLPKYNRAQTKAVSPQASQASRAAQTVDRVERQQTRQVFKNLNLEVAPKEMLALVGKSGCGKSTFLRLLMRFWDIDAGELRLSKTKIREIETACLRRQEAFMTQDTHLFMGTIADNLKLAKPDASKEELDRACRAAAILPLIERLPKGYATPVGELGSTLSGGEKQRLGLARIFLYDAPLILLDEPTSNLDALSEAEVMRALEQWRADKTIVLVSHRASSCSFADRMLHLS